MTNQTIEKIRSYYKPSYSGSGWNYYLTINEEERRLSLSSKCQMFLGFGETAENDQEAIEKGFIKISEMGLFKALFPEHWDRFKSRFEDPRTDAYFESLRIRNPDDGSLLGAIKEIEAELYLRGYERVRFNCYECGVETHWLDGQGTLEEKFENMKERYCGC